ncbi:MAG: PD-(D/E)XK nuclease family protein [Actinomycetia bacterium]|nr:PD-(D/E)XK nuclease family protein [Actinomycetes bacterium]
MALPLPSSLSPSKVASFKDCALAFRFSAIDKLPEAPSEPAIKGTTVHRALELLLAGEPATRTPERGAECLAEALEEIRYEQEWAELGLDEAASVRFAADAEVMLGRYFGIEDPRRVQPVGLELMLEAEIGGVTVRGIIDRLERDADGALVVTDYKTGRTPMPSQEQSRLGGVHFYAFLCKAHFGEIPSRIQLMYLGSEPQIISATPTEQSVRGLERKVGAIWAAVERACQHDDFRPKTSALCNWCSFQQYCPAFGGDPDEARAVALAAAGADSVPVTLEGRVDG